MWEGVCIRNSTEVLLVYAIVVKSSGCILTSTCSEPLEQVHPVVYGDVPYTSKHVFSKKWLQK